jgi:predicted permease
VRRFLRSRFHSRRDVDRELATHLDMLVDELIANGFAPDAARREAARRFGSIEPVAVECDTINQRRLRRTDRRHTMHAFVEDVRQAWRSVVKSPMLTVVVSATLMLGIGATTAIFSVVDQVLLQPLAYPHADRLVAIADDQGSAEPTPISYPEFDGLRTLAGPALDDVGAFFSTTMTLTNVGDARVLDGVRLSAGIPRLLGARPILGRLFTEADDRVTGDRTIMLSENCWRTVFAADPRIIGRVLTLEGLPFIVVGVYPSTATTRLPNELASGRSSDYWQPLRLGASSVPAGTHFMSAIGRLRAGVSIAAATTRLATLRGALQERAGDPHHPLLVSLTERIVGPVRALLAIFIFAVGLMLTIACANVAALLLARGASRQRELAVRAAIGASAGRIASQVLAESCLRALAGGALGAGLAYLIVTVLRRSASIRVPRMSDVSVDARVLAFTLALAIAVGVLCGLVPALRASRVDLATALRDGSRGMTAGLGRDRFRRALVVVEIALSFALLVGTGLLTRSVQQLLATNTGFNPDRVISASITLPATRYPNDARLLAAFDEILRNVRAIPGIEGAALTSNLPVEGGTNGGIKVDGKTFANHQEPVAEKRIVSDGYFETLGARMKAGRAFTMSDAPGAPASAIVNETFVRRFLSEAPPIGRRVDFNWDTKGLQSVVGVVADIKEDALTDIRPVPAIYVPLAQRPTSSIYLIARTAGAPASMLAAIRRAVFAVDRNVPLSEVRTVDDVLRGGISSQRLGSMLVGAFSVVALLLAAVGLYGVINYAVVQRTQELGVRAALGATRPALVSLVLRQGIGFIFAGVALGVLIGRLGANLLASQLFGVTPGATAIYLLVAALLALVAVAAMAVPAVRASRIDPRVALRAD